MMKDITIVVPVYNAEKTLERCLKSIEAQTYTEFTVILVNDGSKDNSKEICETFCQKDSRFTLINQENQGPSAARNKGIDLATTKWLAFVDSDDYIEPDMLFEMHTAGEKNNVDIVLCGHYLDYPNKIIQKNYSRFRSGYYSGEEYQKAIVSALEIGVGGNIPPYSGCRLVRKECMENPKIRFNSEIYRSEDYLLWSLVFFRAKSMFLLSQRCLYHYVENNASITHSYFPKSWEMYKKLFSILRDSLPKTSDISDKLNNMLIKRSHMAMNIASRSKDKAIFKSEIREIVHDKFLYNAAKCISFKDGLKQHGSYFLILRLRLNIVIYAFYYMRYKKFP